MRYLVTGGAGFIGSNIVEELIRRNETVRVLDNFSTGKEENLSAFAGKFELLRGDLRDYGLVQQAVDGMDVVLHQAALPSVPRSVKDPISSNEVNVTGTLNILQTSKDAGVRRVVYASSSSVYGDNPELPKHEGMIPNPLSPYAVSKLAAEKYAVVFSRLYGLETVVLRYFNVFGPRQDPTSQYSAVIPKFIDAILKDERPAIYGDGEQSRDFNYISNVVEANLLAATCDGPFGAVMNCASGTRITLNQLCEKLNALLGKSIKPMYGEPRKGDIKHSLASIELAKRTMGYEPFLQLDDGLKKTIEWYAKHRDGVIDWSE
jgi:UDP-glucose 4-epimerase